MSFQTLHENLGDLTELLNETALDTDDVTGCLSAIKAAAARVNDSAATLTVEDFEAEYEDEDENVIDAEVL